MAKLRKLLSLIIGRKFIIIPLIILLIGIIVWRFIISKKESKIESNQIKRGEVKEVLVLSGEITADEYAKLKFQSSGELAWIGVKEGDKVKKGQALAKLDVKNIVSDLQRASSDLRSAEATVQRAHDDVKNHDKDETFAQKETRTIAEVTKDKAYENYLKALEDLTNATLYSPIEGIVTTVANPFTGINIFFSEPQIEVLNTETIYFEVVADQNEVVDLYVGQEVTITLDPYLDKDLKGKITYISLTPKPGETSTVYEIKVRFDINGSDLKMFKISMTGDANFILSEKEDALYVPIKFINSDNKGKYLNLGRQNNKVYIETGIEGEDRIEVNGNIKEGDTIYD